MSAIVHHRPGFPTLLSSPGREPDDDPLAVLLNYWTTQRGSRALPARSDIDPVDIPDLLQHLGLIDVEQSPVRYRYRLIGSYVQTMFGENAQGKYLDEIRQGPCAEFLAGLYDSAVSDREPILSEAVFAYGSERVVTIRRLILPLAQSDEAPVNMLLFANSFIAPDLPCHATPMLHLRMDAPFRDPFLTSISETYRQAVSLS